MNGFEVVVEEMINIMMNILLFGGIMGMLLSIILWVIYRRKRTPNYIPVILWRVGIIMNVYAFLIEAIFMYSNIKDSYLLDFFKLRNMDFAFIIFSIVIFGILFTNRTIIYELSNSQYDLTK